MPPSRRRQQSGKLLPLTSTESYEADSVRDPDNNRSEIRPRGVVSNEFASSVWDSINVGVVPTVGANRARTRAFRSILPLEPDPGIKACREEDLNFRSVSRYSGSSSQQKMA